MNNTQRFDTLHITSSINYSAIVNLQYIVHVLF